ncbi:MAG TPA: type II toxin-antitoxin system RelB/DinJ family antitoxin [Candidatus Gracilibacteria bacterium]
MSHIQIRIDEAEKEAAAKTLKKMGLTLSGGIKLFLLKVVEEQRLPFEVTAQRKTDTVKMKPQVLDQLESQESLGDIPVQTWNPFNKRKIG